MKWWLESVEGELKKFLSNGCVSGRTKNSGGKFWKRLSSAKDWNVRRRRRMKLRYLSQYSE